MKSRPSQEMCGFFTGNSYSLCCVLVTTIIHAVASLSGHAQGMSISLPSSNAEACQDYFTSEWHSSLDMSDETDLLYNLVPREIYELQKYSFANGIASTTSTGVDPHFRILAPVDHLNGFLTAIPDDTTRFGVNRPIYGGQAPFYDTLSMRMYADKDSLIQVQYEKQDGSAAFTEAVPVYSGWNVYNLNLRTAGVVVSSGNYSWETTPVTSIRVDPVAYNGALIKLDWVHLTPNAARCPTASIDYVRSDATGLLSVFVDNDTDPKNGVNYRFALKDVASGRVSVPTTKLFPGTYQVYGYVTRDYATGMGNPWDMDTAGTDVKTNSLLEISPASVSFASGRFCATSSGTDPAFFLNVPADAPIEASKFSRLSFDAFVETPMDVVIYFYGLNGQVKGYSGATVNANGRYNVNIGAAAGWSGDIYALRIDPGSRAAASFCFDNITLANSNLASIPTVSATSPVLLTVKERPLATFAQPDKEGGTDYFASVTGDPSNMNSAADIKFTAGLSSATIYPANPYTDSAGLVRIGDFFEATSTAGSDDPINGSVYKGTPINPDLYRLVCFDLDVIKDPTVYRTVARVLWFRDDVPVNGDDIVIKTNGEKRYCLRLDSLPIEGLASGSPHPWQWNSNGTGIDYFRVDAIEESEATTFRIGDIRVASDHLANSRFAFVIEGSLNKTVEVFLSAASRSTTGGFSIGTLAAGRSSQVLMWDSGAVAEGFYYPYLVVEGNTYYADAPVRVLRSFNDATPPVLGVNSPQSGYRFVNQMQVAGHAVDRTRVATLEVMLDGVLIHTLRPNLFNKEVRDLYPAYPYASSSLFNQFIDLSSVAMGAHIVRIVAYDTAGNSTEQSFAVEKVASDPTSDVTFAVPNDSPVSVPVSGITTSNPGKFRLTKASVSKKGSLSISLVGAGSGLCTVTLSVGKTPKVASNTVDSYLFPSARANLTAKKMGIDPKAGKIYLLGARTCSNTQFNSSSAVLLRYQTRKGALKTRKAVAAALKKRFVAMRASRR